MQAYRDQYASLFNDGRDVGWLGSGSRGTRCRPSCKRQRGQVSEPAAPTTIGVPHVGQGSLGWDRVTGGAS